MLAYPWGCLCVFRGPASFSWAHFFSSVGVWAFVYTVGCGLLVQCGLAFSLSLRAWIQQSTECIWERWNLTGHVLRYFPAMGMKGQGIGTRTGYLAYDLGSLVDLDGDQSSAIMHSDTI